jgi:hypothetical protein
MKVHKKKKCVIKKNKNKKVSNNECDKEIQHQKNKKVKKDKKKWAMGFGDISHVNRLSS